MAGKTTDFYFGGNGTGVLISARPTCKDGEVIGWTDKIRATDIVDGLSKTFLIGEMHIARRNMGVLPNEGPIYCGSEVYYSTRIVGPGARLALGPNDQAASQYAFGSWHPGVCHFAFADGSVQALSVNTNTDLLAKLGNRNDGSELKAIE